MRSAEYFVPTAYRTSSRCRDCAKSASGFSRTFSLAAAHESLVRPAVRSWDLAQAARSPGCAATRATRATTEPAATEPEPHAEPAAAATSAAAAPAATTSDCGLHVVADDPGVHAARCHRTRIR